MQEWVRWGGWGQEILGKSKGTESVPEEVLGDVEWRELNRYSPIAPSASLIAQNLKNAIAFNATSSECGLLVNAIKQLTQSVNVVTSVSVMKSKCSLTIFSIVSNASRTIICDSSLAAVVKTMNIDFQPDFTLLTLASTICDTHLQPNFQVL